VRQTLEQSILRRVRRYSPDEDPCTCTDQGPRCPACQRTKAHVSKLYPCELSDSTLEELTKPGVS
jgi:hypothetical protein